MLVAGLLIAFPGLIATQQVELQATEQQIQDALPPPPVEPPSEPAVPEPEKK